MRPCRYPAAGGGSGGSGVGDGGGRCNFRRDWGDAEEGGGCVAFACRDRTAYRWLSGPNAFLRCLAQLLVVLRVVLLFHFFLYYKVVVPALSQCVWGLLGGVELGQRGEQRLDKTVLVCFFDVRTEQRLGIPGLVSM